MARVDSWDSSEFVNKDETDLVTLLVKPDTFCPMFDL
jgi:hypothetical protein